MSFNITRNKGTHQAHIVMGCEVMGGQHPQRFALMLLNNILGGPCLSSRFNTLLRERRGLVYTVESSYVAYPDKGIWTVYFGCDAKDVEKCKRLIIAELTRYCQTPLTERLLSAAKKQLKGQIGISCDNRESYAFAFAKAFAHYNVQRSIPAINAAIDAVTPDDIQRVAMQYLNPERISMLCYK